MWCYLFQYQSFEGDKTAIASSKVVPERVTTAADAMTLTMEDGGAMKVHDNTWGFV